MIGGLGVDVEKFIEHSGVLGMKWGQHKQNEAAFRKKLTALGKNKALKGTSDAKRFKYRNQHVAVRIGKTAATLTAQMVVGDILMGKTSKYYYTNPNELRKRVTAIATTTAKTVALNDLLARSAAKRYTDQGQRLPGTKKPLITKEDGIEMGIQLAARVGPVAKWMAATKLHKIRTERARNEAAFNRWGANILPQKVDHVIWQSKDLKTAIVKD